MYEKEQLGEAFASAMKKKGVGPTEVARHFKVQPPSVTDWKATGRIAKRHLEKMLDYFSDVVGPEHWGLTAKSPLWLGLTANTLTLHEPAAPRITPPNLDEAMSAIENALSCMGLAERERVAQLFQTFALSPGQAMKNDISALLKQGAQKKRAA
jgi:hypothetical protein